MNPYLRASLLCFAICAAIVAFALLGCSSPTEPLSRTPGGIWIDENGYTIDLARVDSDWAKAKECNGYTGRRLPFVEIMDPSICKDGAECFPCTESETGWCAGVVYVAYGRVRVPPGLAALYHEFSHYACALAGRTDCENYAGRCGL